MDVWKPSYHRTRDLPPPASTRATSKPDGDSGWDWSADRDGQRSAGDVGEGKSGSGGLDGGDPWWEQDAKDPWASKGSSSYDEFYNGGSGKVRSGDGQGRSGYGDPRYDGWLDEAHLRQFHMAHVTHTTAMSNGKWYGDANYNYQGPWTEWDSYEGDKGKPTEKLSVPEFDGEGNNDQELGRTTRSYVRKVQVWLRCTKLPPRQRGLALYNAFSGKAWIYAEELDVDRLASDTGVSYFLHWVQTRFTEVEVSKIAQLMTELFKRGKRKHDQSIRADDPEVDRGPM